MFDRPSRLSSDGLWWAELLVVEVVDRPDDRITTASDRIERTLPLAAWSMAGDLPWYGRPRVSTPTRLRLR